MPLPNPLIPNPIFSALDPPWQLTALDAWTASVNASIQAIYNLFGDPTHFQPQYTGFATPLFGDAQYYLLGNFVAAFFSPVQGLSNDVLFGIANLPAEIAPVTAQLIATPSVCFIDNGNNLGAGHNVATQVGAGTQIGFDIDSNSQGWTASGQKGIQFPFTICWFIT